MTTKYVIIRVEDMRRHLSVEMRAQLLEIAKAISIGRSKDGKESDAPLFVLSPATDACAMSAIECYIESCRDAADCDEPGRIEAAESAAAARMKSIFGNKTPRTPD